MNFSLVFLIKVFLIEKCVCMWKTGNLEIPSRKQTPPRWQPCHFNFKLPWSFSAPGEGWASPGSNTRASYKIRLTLEYVNIDVDLFLSILLVYRTEDRWNRLWEITALGARCALIGGFDSGRVAQHRNTMNECLNFSCHYLHFVLRRDRWFRL